MNIPISPVTAQILMLAAPTSPESAPASVQFSRFREVELPWLELIETAQSNALRGMNDVSVELSSLAYFEKYWSRFGDMPFRRATPQSRPDQASLDVFDLKTELWTFKDWFTDTDTKDIKGAVTEAAKPVAGMFCTTIPLSRGKRTYTPLNADGKPFTNEDFNPKDSNIYGQLLDFHAEGKIHAWQLVADTAANLETSRTSAWVLDISTAELLEDYHRAEALETLSIKLSDWANGPALAASADLQKLWESDEDFTNFSNRLLRAASLKQRSRAIKLHLSAVAKERGYVLPFYELKVTRPDTGAVEEWAAGHLYKEKTVKVHWEVTEKRTVYVRQSGACSSSSTPTQVDVKVPRQADMLVYEEITLGEDPADKERKRLKDENFSVFDAFEEDAGWVLNDKSSLELLIARCDMDEGFRQKCAVILHYRQTKPMGLYPQNTTLVVQRPLPGTGPSIFPRLFLREALSYNLMWTGAELGPLVSSINLAPGEERTVTASRSFSDEVSESVSRKSLLEESSSYTEDFSSQLEKEFTNEISKNSASSTSLGLSGSYMGIGGSLGQTNSSSTGLKNTSRELTRIARKTAQSFNRKAQSEMTITSTRKQTVQSSEGRTSTIKNINSGRTLNLLVYQINNRFEGGIFLNDLEITVQQSTELIAGTGIYPRRTVRLHEIEKIVPLLQPDTSPIPILSPDAEQSYWRKLSKALLDTIEDEYERYESPLKSNDDDSTNSASAITIKRPSALEWRKSRKSLAATDTQATIATAYDKVQAAELAARTANMTLSFAENEDKGNLLQDLNAKKKAVREARELAKKSRKEAEIKLDSVRLSGFLALLEPEDLMQELKDILESIIINREPLDSELLIVASGALHMDSMIGLSPATEPYAEQMRELERAKTAMGVEYLAIKNRILSGVVTNYISQVETTTANGAKYLRLQLKEPITQLGDYDVYYKGQLAGGSATLKIESGSGKGLVMEWVGGDVPVKADLEKYLVLIHTPTRNRIFFLGA